MRRLVLLALFGLLASSAHSGDEKRKPPKRPDQPFTVYVDAHPRGEAKVVEAILEAREELEKKLRKKKKWFTVSERPDAAEITVELEAYWVREERRTHDQRHVAGANTHTVQVDTIYRYHSLRSVVTAFGTPREMLGTQTKRNGGSAKGAASDLANRLERYCKENYWKLDERRRSWSRAR